MAAAAKGGSTTTKVLPKKAKQQMRERRRKKIWAAQLARGDITTEQFQQLLLQSRSIPVKKVAAAPKSTISSSLPSADDAAMASTDVAPASPAAIVVSNHDHRVPVPVHLTSPAEIRTFRKKARRLARQQNFDADQLVFVDAHGKVMPPSDNGFCGAPDHDAKPQQRRRQKLPHLNELVAAERAQQTTAARQAAHQHAVASVPLDQQAQYVALDCEMVGVGGNSSGSKSGSSSNRKDEQSMLARVSLVDWHGQMIFDQYVQVAQPVTNFRTHVSGILPRHIKAEHGALPFGTVQARVGELLRDKILVGHALRHDLDALVLLHPKERCRDTATYRPLQRRLRNKWKPRKLRDLVQEHVGVRIQQEGQAHDSVEDARAVMQLYQLVRVDWERELANQQAKRKK